MVRPRRREFRPLVDRLGDRCLLAAMTPSPRPAAYGLGTTATSGAGKTIAIVDAYNDPYIQQELAAFDAKYGLPGTSTTAAGAKNVSNSLTVVNQAGGSTLPSANSGWAEEIALDVEWAHALAPGARIVLV